jgi:hypothetical protein
MQQQISSSWGVGRSPNDDDDAEDEDDDAEPDDLEPAVVREPDE